jgi:hypothetical protein
MVMRAPPHSGDGKGEADGEEQAHEASLWIVLEAFPG